MDLKELFNGVAIVIDDEINDQKANINIILKQIERQSIPLLTYEAIPSEETVRHFQNLSFLLLDWRLVKKEISNEEFGAGVSIPAHLQEHEANKNIKLINKLKDVCFCPIFIFTNENTEEIITKLEEEGLYKKDRPNHIFIKPKSDFTRIPKRISEETFDKILQNLVSIEDKDYIASKYYNNEDETEYVIIEDETIDDYDESNKIDNVLQLAGYSKLFEEVNYWLKNNPSVYVLKEWEREYQKCKNRLFSEFQDLSPFWPRIMWKNFEADGANKSLELGELISRNLYTRMTPFEFNNKLLSQDNPDIDRDELRQVLEGERFLKELHSDIIGTGDVFREEKDGEYTYWLNIRAQCDLVRTKNPSLYCLPGKELIQKPNGKIDNISFSNGEYLEKNYHAIVAFIDDGKIIEFVFRDMEIKELSTLKENDITLIGRLLPPYINKIQQRYALYLQRQGLPRIPDAAIFDRRGNSGS